MVGNAHTGCEGHREPSRLYQAPNDNSGSTEVFQALFWSSQPHHRLQNGSQKSKLQFSLSTTTRISCKTWNGLMCLGLLITRRVNLLTEFHKILDNRFNLTWQIIFIFTKNIGVEDRQVYIVHGNLPHFWKVYCHLPRLEM